MCLNLLGVEGVFILAKEIPQRLYRRSQTKKMLERQNGKCRVCDEPKTLREVAGHHVERHADGGSTTLENGAAVCHNCHQKLHSKK